MRKMVRMIRRDRPEFLKPLVKYLTTNLILTRYYISLKNYQELHPGKVEFIYERPLDLYYSNIKFYGKTAGSGLTKVEGFKKFAVVFNDVYVIGSSSMILLDDQYIYYEAKSQEREANMDFTDCAMQFCKGDHCIIEGNFTKIVYDEAISLCSNYGINYYHFLYEIIAKFEALNSLRPDINIPLLVNEECLRIPQYRELLNFFNVDKRDIIPLKKLELYRVKKLYHFSWPNLIPPNYKRIGEINAADNLFDIDSLLFLRTGLLQMVKPVNRGPRIFLSRKNASARRKYNEEKIVEHIKHKGFVTVYPEEYSIAEQVSIFNEAEWIVGASGAAFSNILFCRKGCRVICLTNFAVDLSIFSPLAAYAGADLVYLFDENLPLENSSELHSDFKISPSQLDLVLDNI